MESKGKWVAVGKYCMVRVHNSQATNVISLPKYMDKGTLLDPVGTMVSIGSGCMELKGCLNCEVSFNQTMTVKMFGDADKDEELFFVLPDIAIVAVRDDGNGEAV